MPFYVSKLTQELALNRYGGDMAPGQEETMGWKTEDIHNFCALA